MRDVSTLEAVRLLEKVTDYVHTKAVLNVVAGPYSTGRLARSMRKRVWITTTGAAGEVWSDLPQAQWVNDGTRPHYIQPRGNWPLRFFWRKVGKTVRLAYVRHPGQRAQHFMTGPMVEAATRYNLIVTIN